MPPKKTPENIKSMFNALAPKYDFFNEIISFGLHRIIKKLAIKELDIKKGYKVLDLCTGTGDVAGLVKQMHPDSDVFGVDFSQKMLSIASSEYPDIDFSLQDCCDLHFDNNYFDVATMTFGLRNIENYDKALSEVHRILKECGVFMHLDFGKSSEFFDNFFKAVIKFLVMPFVKDKNTWNYLLQSKEAFFSPDELIKIVEDKGFILIKKKGFLFGVISAQYFRVHCKL